MYLLDTCVVSEARWRAPEAVGWLLAAQSETLWLSASTIGEIMKDVMMKLWTDSAAAAVMRRWLDELRFVYGPRILPIDDAVATIWSRPMAQCTRPVVEMLILATAHVNNKIIVTRNVVGFADTGFEGIDPWTS